MFLMAKNDQIEGHLKVVHKILGSHSVRLLSGINHVEDENSSAKNECLRGILVIFRILTFQGHFKVMH